MTAADGPSSAASVATSGFVVLRHAQSDDGCGTAACRCIGHGWFAACAQLQDVADAASADEWQNAVGDAARLAAWHISQPLTIHRARRVCDNMLAKSLAVLPAHGPTSSPVA